MIIERLVFQAKYGKGDDLVQLIKDGQEMIARHGASSQRVLTDLTGRFFTVVWESEFESIAESERQGEVFADPEFGPWFERMTELVESGERQFFTIEQ